MKPKITCIDILTFIAIVLCFFLSGCFYGRVTYESGEVKATATVLTLGKQIVIDPNGYSSDTDKMRVVYPPLFLESK